MSQQSFRLGTLSSPVQRRPTALEWSRDQVLRLVELYHSQPALWDSTDVKFKDRQVKRWALMTIASQMSLPPIDVEKKIHCLRTQFNREYLKMKTNARKPTWFAYQPLSFVLRNKQDVSFDMSQWRPASMNIKEEFLDEYIGDDVDVRPITDERSSVNLPIHDSDMSHDTEHSNCTSSDDNINDDNNSVCSLNQIKTSSAVEVILHEQTDEEQSLSHNQKATQVKSTNSIARVHSSFNETDDDRNNRNERNNNNTVNDQLALYGKLLTDELFRVTDYFTLQLAKYEISKIIFRVTTGSYDKDVMEHDKVEPIKLDFNRPGNSDFESRPIDNYNRMSTVDELKLFAAVVVNELSVVTDIYALQVAKFYINQVLFHATTAGLASQTASSHLTSPNIEELRHH